MDLAARTRLGRYEIRSHIGAGGMGEVYLAEDTSLHRLVAIKLLSAEFAANADRLHRFALEAVAASSLNHPNILTIHEIGAEGKHHFIASEYVEGETLRHHLKHSRMKLREVLDTFVQVASALSTAHQAGIIHRDIKPENIMLRPDGIVKVLDFGLAKLTEKPTPVTASEAATLSKKDTDPGTVMGTVQYMSPEQARGKDVDARSDIFSLGIVLYETVAGRAPFTGESSTDVLAAILDKEPLPLARFTDNVPTELQRIVSKCLRKERDERYQTMKDVLLDVKELREEMALEAKLERSIRPATSNIENQQTLIAEGGMTREAAPQTGAARAQTTSSAEVILAEIRRHKRGVAAIVASLVVLGIVAAVIGPHYFGNANPPNRAPIESLAVLPFENASGDADSEYLSDGITESLINSLSQLPHLKVIARSSVFRYKGKGADPQKVASELGVQALMTGRVVQRGDRLDISVELVDAREGTHLWGEQFARKAADIFAVQEEIARQVSDNLKVKLSGAEEQRVTRHHTENIEAYQLYLKGRYFTDRATKEGFEKAIEYFQQAIAKDPNYALAYDGLAYNYIIFTDWLLPAREALTRAREAAKKALEIDDTLAEAHSSLGMVSFWYEWDWPAAEAEFKRAIDLNPNYAKAHEWYGWYLSTMGKHEEVIAELKRAQELDPLSLLTNTDYGTMFFYARRYDQSIEQLRKTLDMDRNYWVAQLYLGRAYVQKGKLSEAIAAFQQAKLSSEGVIPEPSAALARAYAVVGKTDEAQKLIEDLAEQSRRTFVPSYVIATIYTGLGDKEQSLTWLRRAYEERSFYMTWLKTDPELDSLRGDRRFQDLVRRVGLPQ